MLGLSVVSNSHTSLKYEEILILVLKECHEFLNSFECQIAEIST
jgi:hypothetical protein